VDSRVRKDDSSCGTLFCYGKVVGQFCKIALQKSPSNEGLLAKLIGYGELNLRGGCPQQDDLILGWLFAATGGFD
jgi:hypothetical protein